MVKQQTIPSDVLDYLSSRYIMSIPESKRKNLFHICFQVELALWFYVDEFCRFGTRKLVPCNMREFSMHIFWYIPFLRPHLPNVDTILSSWQEYKNSLPSFGAIMLNENMSKVLLVQNYWSKSSWGFPKGKINEDEDPLHCAVREVQEETGFDISRFIDKKEYVESVINGRMIRLYIITGVPENTYFQPTVRNEIGDIKWFSLKDLPHSMEDKTIRMKKSLRPGDFYMVVPFLRRLKLMLVGIYQHQQQR